MIKGHKKIHIVPVAFEIDRAVKPVLENGADKVYILTGAQENEGPKSSSYAEKVKRALEKEAKIEIINYGFYDYTNIFSKLAEIGKREKDNDVLINLSSGGRIVAIAGTLAASMYGWTIYYAVPETYKGGKPSGLKDVFEIMTYPIEQPDPDLVSCLKLMHSANTQKSLILKLEKARLMENVYDGKKLTKGAQMEFRRRFLEPLLEKNWIEKDGIGRGSRIYPTEEGKEIVKIFG